MGAKLSVISLTACVAAVGGCSTLERLAPPGIVKYEEIADDRPQSPEIRDRIAARKTDGKERNFPILGEQPQSAPQGIPKTERVRAESDLISARDGLAADIAADRALMAEEIGEPVLVPGVAEDDGVDLDDAADALRGATEEDKTRAEAERR